MSLLDSLTKIYNGYVQLFPRLAIQIPRAFPIVDFSKADAVLGAATLAGLALLIFHMSRGHLQTWQARLLLVGAMVLLPLAPGELLNNIVNVPWWLFFATFWLLLWRPEKVQGKILAAVVVFLAVASDPLVGLFLPLVLIRVIVLRKFRDNFVVIGFTLGLVYEGATILASGGENSFSGLNGTWDLQSIPTEGWIGLVDGKQLDQSHHQS